MTPESTIGPYRIVSKLGEGGMGQVWRARDPRLNRDVAIKILPPALANDAQYMARFEREAQTLAALNHPNIAHVYGIEKSALVMELVEGEDLRGPLPLDTAVAYALQIAAGLEAAHDKGIVHRDLKPANIKVTPDGVVKILDFGLAKSASETAAATSAASPTISPTLSLAMTQAGMILGTAAYMAPEQARGKPVDKRADIWAFGVVLYEMLTGRQLFGGGDTVTDTLASVVKDTPDLDALPTGTPPNVRSLLERCLRKDPKLRMRDIGEARLALSEPEAPAPTSAPTPAKTSRLPWIVAALALLAALSAAGIAWRRPEPAAPTPIHFSISLPGGAVEGTAPAGSQAVPSPDGKLVAFVASSDQRSWLWIRPVASFAAYRLDRTEGANFPFWSPDSRFIGFFTEDKLKKIPATGGVPQVICDIPRSSSTRTAGDGGTWRDDGTIVFAAGASDPLQRVFASGGAAEPLNKLEEADGERAQSWPQFLPGGRHLLYLSRNADSLKSSIYIQELSSGRRYPIVKTPVRAVYVPAGYLLFMRNDGLFAQRADPKTFQLVGEPIQVVEDIANNPVTGRAAFSAAANLLVYRAGDVYQNSQLVWHDRSGAHAGTVGKSSAFRTVRLSPDGRSAAVVAGRPGKADAWTIHLASGAQTQLTTSGEIIPVPSLPGPWSADSQKLLVNQNPGRPVLEVTPGSGKIRELTGRICNAADWSADGRTVVCAHPIDGVIAFSPDDDEPARVLSAVRIMNARLSPDGKRIAYTSQQIGFQVTIAAFPTFADRRQVSVEGGFNPQWRKDGRELFFAAGNSIMSVEVGPGEKILTGVPKVLFTVATAPRPVQFSASADGSRFLVIERDAAEDQPLARVVVNWAAELKQ